MKKLFAMLLALALIQALAVVHANLSEGELLEAPKAFAMTLKAPAANTIEIQWKIANGYYLYRDKFKFEALDDNLRLLPPILPAGIRKKDEFFGEVETYRQTIKIKLPFTRTTAGASTTLLRVTSQGCADVGVCYPPLIQEVSLKLPAGKGTMPVATLNNSSQDKGIKSLADLGKQIEPDGSSERDFLPVDQAFALSVEARDSNTLVAHLQVAPGYYLYRDKTHFQLSGASNTQMAGYDLPKGQIKVDPYIGETEIYHDRVDIKLPLMRNAQQRSVFTLKAGYQGCAEQGICYPPTTKNIDIVLPQGEIQGAVFTPADDANASGTTNSPGTGSDIGAFLVAIAGAFGVGLLLTFTPCVLPMIPILSSIIVGQGNAPGNTKLTKLKGGMLSLSYVMGTAVTYTGAGILAGATGDQLQAYFQNPYAIGAVSAIFVLLSLSMFGFYELQMPAFIQSRMTEKSQNIRGGTLFGTFVLGILSSLIVGACVSPLIIGVLGVAIQKADPVLGGTLMFSMAMGMGVVLIAIGIGAGFLLPKAGAWMDRVKQVFGVLLLAVAIYLLSALPQVPVLLLWAALLIVSAVYLGATQSLPHDAGNWRYLWKGMGTVLLLWGVLALLGGLAGERDIFNPLPRAAYMAMGSEAPAATRGTPAENTELFERYHSLAQVEAALTAARAAGKPAILDFYATWCKDCVRMEKGTLADARVRAALKGYVLIQADVTETNVETNAIKQRYKVLGPPAMLFFAANGEEKTALRFYGYRAIPEFLALLEKI